MIEAETSPLLTDYRGLWASIETFSFCEFFRTFYTELNFANFCVPDFSRHIGSDCPKITKPQFDCFNFFGIKLSVRLSSQLLFGSIGYIIKQSILIEIFNQSSARKLLELSKISISLNIDAVFLFFFPVKRQFFYNILRLRLVCTLKFYLRPFSNNYYFAPY